MCADAEEDSSSDLMGEHVRVSPTQPPLQTCIFDGLLQPGINWSDAIIIVMTDLVWRLLLLDFFYI